jgi:cysteine desulfurase family protein (TIGR01976 family)
VTPLDLLSGPLPELLARPIAEQFPGLRAGSARFDGPGGTLVHAAVRDAMAGYLGSEHVANDHGAFPASGFSADLLHWSAGRVRALIGAAGGHVVYGPNMTTLTAMFLRALAPQLGPGDEIVCTELDHEANVAPWAALARSRGATLKVARLRQPGLLPVAAVAEQLGERTSWVAVTAASNALGTVPDLPAITAAAHAAGARIYVDGVQAVAHRAIDVVAMGCDAFVTSPYKWYGPHCGVLWLRDDVAAPLRLAEQVPSAGDELPDRLALGTTNFEAVLGTGVAAEVLRRWDHAELRVHEHKLTELLIGRLTAIPEVRLLGPTIEHDRVPVVTFQVADRPAGEVAATLAAAGVAVWDGTFYASPAMRAVSPCAPDSVRAGIARYTTEDEVHALADGVHAIAVAR